MIDVEATCDDAGTVPGPEMEIIEVGAVFVDGASLAPLDDNSSNYTEGINCEFIISPRAQNYGKGI